MSGSHEKLPMLFWIQLILVAIVGTMYLLAPKAETHSAETEISDTNHEAKSAAENLQPVGKVALMSDSSGASNGAAKSGKAIYNETCQTCHKAGIANAPKLDDKAAWELRVANGLDGMVKTAITGKGAMPPKGGNMSLSDDEMKSVVVYMAKQAGFDLSSSEKSDSMPEKKEAEVSTTTEADTAKTVEEPAAPSAPAAPAAPEVTTSEPVVTAVTDTTVPVDNAEGERVYKSACFACHDAGIAGSPKTGDKENWVARIATGSEALYFSAINGKGVMPPKGGNMGLSDDEVNAAVDYMVSQSQ